MNMERNLRVAKINKIVSIVLAKKHEMERSRQPIQSGPFLSSWFCKQGSS